MRRCLFILLLSLAGLTGCASAPGGGAAPDAGMLGGTWVREMEAGGRAIAEGLVLDADGDLGLLGIHTMHGVSWRLEGETLVLATNTGRYPEPHETRLRVDALEPDTLRLSGAGYLSGEWRRDDRAAGRVSGTVTYRQRIALPANATVHVELVDASRQDAPARFVAGRIVATRGRQVPIPFRIHYRAAAIDPRLGYAVRATITVDGERRFITTARYPVITGGSPTEVELVLEPFAERKSGTGGERGATSIDLPATYSGTVACPGCPPRELTLNLRTDGVFMLRDAPAARAAPGEVRYDLGRWSLLEGGRTLRLAGGSAMPRLFAILDGGRLRMLNHLGQEIDPNADYEVERAAGFEPVPDAFPMRGLFQYLADAAVFTECESGKRLPVAMERDYLAAERAYVAERSAPGAPLLVTLEGRWAERPKMEGPGTQETLVIEKFGSARPDETCTPRGADLTDTYWKLVLVAGATVIVSPGQREPHMVLRGGEGRVQGFGGCNGFFGGYEIEGGAIHFSRMGATMMACPAGMDTEDSFLKALAAADRYEIVGEHLLLYQGDRMVARFEAVYLR